jgi:hypothetical protein
MSFYSLRFPAFQKSTEFFLLMTVFKSETDRVTLNIAKLIKTRREEWVAHFVQILKIKNNGYKISYENVIWKARPFLKGYY